jgi:hypothetical protein
VAPGAGHRQPEHPAGHHVDAVVDDVVDVVVEHPAESEVAHRRQVPRLDLRLDLVGGQLLGEEAVEGQVLVEGADDVIAVGVGVGPDAVGAVHEHAVLGVGVAGHVQPVAGPALAVGRRGQQPLHHLLVSAGRGVALEGPDLGHRRRQAGQVERDPADQGAAVGRRRGRQPLFLQLRQDEVVNRVGGPVGVPDGGQGRPADRPVGPVPARGREVDAPRLPRRRGGPAARVGGAQGDPALEVCDHGRRQRALGRHAQVFVRVAEGLEQQAVARLAGHHRRARVAALAGRLPAVQEQAALGPPGLVRVAFVAVSHQDGADLRLEEGGAVLGGGPVGRSRQQRREQQQDPRQCRRSHEAPRARSGVGRVPGQGGWADKRGRRQRGRLL